MNITKNQPFSKAVTYDSALPAYAKLLFYTLERLVGVDGCVQATVDYLAELMGTSARTVIRYTPVLEKAGYISVVRAPRNSKIPNTYRLCCVPQSQQNGVSEVTESPVVTASNVSVSHIESTASVPESQPKFAPALPHRPPDVPESQSNNSVLSDVVRNQTETLNNKHTTTAAVTDLPYVEGMTRENVAKLVTEYGSTLVKTAVEYANQQTNLYNKPGFIVRALQGEIAGLDLKTLVADDRRMRYVTGKYADFIQW